MTIPVRHSTAFVPPSSDSSYSGSEHDDELLNNVVADYRRINVEQDDRSSPGEENLRDAAWLNEHNRRQDNIDTIVVPFSGRLPRNFISRSFSPSSEWEGYVEEIGEEEFTVRLVNINSTVSLPEDIATFAKSDLSERERNLLVPGAIVRWVVGLERLPTDQRRRVSELHFRNLPAHSWHDFERARKKAKDLLNSITLDEGS